MYFFVLREENDLDERLGLTMLESVSDLSIMLFCFSSGLRGSQNSLLLCCFPQVPQEYEEEVLRMARQMVINEGGSTEELDNRLKELQEQRLIPS